MLLLLALLVQTAPQSAPVLPQGPALREAIQAADAALFQTFFEQCDPARLQTLIAPDFEMYHDRAGLVAKGDGKGFVATYATECAARKAPDAARNRRALLPETLDVQPIPGFGAIEEADHVFYESTGSGPEKLVGKAHFVHVWQLTPQGWQLSRALSYAHRPLKTLQ